MAALYHGATIFDGDRLAPGALLIEGGRVGGIFPPDASPEGVEKVALNGGVLAPGFVDLQLNGGGGVMFNDAPTAETVTRIAEAHARLGALTVLPTLITDTAGHSRAAVEAVETAIAEGVPGVAGLHLEGPHLSVSRKGAHEVDLIRPMTDADLAFLLDAARRLPRLMMTVAPENVTNQQISTLTSVGVIVALGHTDADFETCRAAADAGAGLATHLFNAMSQFGNREPGLVGAVLSDGRLSAGLIADAIHVHPATIAAALRAKAGPGEIFLVSDAMAPAGSDITHFTLNGREIRRADGRLTLADGTLAGADLDLARAIRVLRDDVGLPLDRALAMATSIPAKVMRASAHCGALRPGMDADFLHLTDSLVLEAVWRKGVPVQLGSA